MLGSLYFSIESAVSGISSPEADRQKGPERFSIFPTFNTGPVHPLIAISRPDRVVFGSGRHAKMDLSFHFWYLQEFRSQHIGQQDTSHTGSHSCLAYSSPSLLGSSIPSICLSCNYGGMNHYLSKPTSYWIPDLLGTETLPAAARPGQRCVPCLLCSAVNPMGYWPSTQYTIWHRLSGFFP